MVTIMDLLNRMIFTNPIEDLHIVNSSYHAAFQICTGESEVLSQLLINLNELARSSGRIDIMIE